MMVGFSCFSVFMFSSVCFYFHEGSQSVFIQISLNCKTTTFTWQTKDCLVLTAPVSSLGEEFGLGEQETWLADDALPVTTTVFPRDFYTFYSLGYFPWKKLRLKSLQKGNHEQEGFCYSLSSLHNLFICLEAENGYGQLNSSCEAGINKEIKHLVWSHKITRTFTLTELT